MRLLCIMIISALGIMSGVRAELPQKATPPSEAPLLPWTTDYAQALASAKTQSMPIYLFFTGSTWCIWCKKMEKEFHNQDAFRQKVVGKFLFVKIDLPAGSPPSDATKELLEKYKIKGVPTVVIISPEGSELARFSYQQALPEQYAEIVLEAAYTTKK
jgi:protein disulfide-isomerase